MAISFETAVAAHQAGDFATAEAGYLQFLTSPNALYNLGRVYRDTDRQAEAERIFRRLCDYDPDDAWARRQLAMALLTQRRYAEAWPHYDARRVVLGLKPPPLRMGLEGVGGGEAAYLAGAAGHPGGAAGRGVGVMTNGDPRHENDRHRSMDPQSAQALLELGRDLSPAATGCRDLRDTAAIVARLDLVITVDTAMAHLTLALGKPCWVLLPRIRMDWRWNDGLRSDWYPQVRMFRQGQPGDWAPVLHEVRTALEAQGLAPR